MDRPRARWLYVQSKRIVCYTALDVMLIATPLIGAAFGPMSELLLDANTFPLCATFGRIYPATDGTCMRIDVIPSTGYWFNVAAIVIYFVSGFDGAPTSRYLYRRLWPEDPDPVPPSCKCD